MVNRCPGLDSLPASLPILSALTTIKYTDISITQTSLAKYLLGSCTTLKHLHLWNIKLIAGTWQPIFQMLQKEFDLIYVDVKSLQQENRTVDFYWILQQRSLIIDSETSRERGQDWDCAIKSARYAYNCADAEHGAKEQELDDLIAEDWIWVVVDVYSANHIVLDGDDGIDDVKSWMTRIEDVYEMSPVRW